MQAYLLELGLVDALEVAVIHRVYENTGTVSLEYALPRRR